MLPLKRGSNLLNGSFLAVGRHVVTLINYAVLVLIAVPWYWKGVSSAQNLVIGFPLWVVVSLAGALGIALQTAWVLRRPWPGEEEQA